MLIVSMRFEHWVTAWTLAQQTLFLTSYPVLYIYKDAAELNVHCKQVSICRAVLQKVSIYVFPKNSQALFQISAKYLKTEF